MIYHAYVNAGHPTEKPSKFINDPDYVPSVFVFSNTTSNEDKRCCYERLMKRRRHKHAKAAARKGHSHKNFNLTTNDHHDEAPQSPSLQTPSNIIDQATDSAAPTECILTNEDNMSAEENVVTKEDRSVVAKVDENLSTDIDSNHWYAIEKKITDQQELIEMLQSELRATSLL